MIIDSDTNQIFFSKWLMDDQRYLETFEKIASLLNKYHIKYRLLEGTKDIWARDYMPIQTDEKKYVQFRYEPSYLKKCPQYRSDPREVNPINNIFPFYSDINLDGGNVVKWKDKVIISKRMVSENPTYNESKLRSELEKILQAQVILIKDLNPYYDLTGHSDGYIRFIDGNTLLVNELKNEFKYWRDDFLKMIRITGLDYVELPWFEHKEKRHPDSALGIYINYLEIGELIVMPIFEVKENKDQLAFDKIKEVFPHKKVETVNINIIGRGGGLMNCISWNIKV